jgi:hypothetical protein
MLPKRTLLSLLGFLTLSPCGADAQDSAGPEILVLGTVHLANPGRDLHNAEVDDVLSAKRQRELGELLRVLRRFGPTKIALEADVNSSRLADRYRAYRNGEYTLTRNEIDQIGLRLAAEMGHESVYSVDEDGDFPYYRVQNYAKAHGREEEFDSLQARTGVRVARESEFLRTHSLLEALELINADSSVARAVSEYYETYMPFGQPYEYAGADLIARWFERNVRIYHNIRALATSPDARVLVIFGAGHLGWLRRMITEDGSVRLRSLAEFIDNG